MGVFNFNKQNEIAEDHSHLGASGFMEVGPLEVHDATNNLA